MGAAEAFAKPWSGRRRPLLIEATRCGSYASVSDRCAGRGFDRFAAIIQGDATSSRVAIPLLVDTPGVMRDEARWRDVRGVEVLDRSELRAQKYEVMYLDE